VLQLYVMATSFYTQIVVDNDREAAPALCGVQSRCVRGNLHDRRCVAENQDTTRSEAALPVNTP
jgi:hypothetical protein